MLITSIKTFRYGFLIYYAAILICHDVVFPFCAKSEVLNEIKSIYIKKDPYRVGIQLNERPRYKAVMIDAKEFMIAFKGSSLSKYVEKLLQEEPSLKTINLKMQENDVATFVVNTERDLRGIDPKWVDNKNELVVKVIWKEEQIKKESRKIRVKRKLKLKRKIKDKIVKKELNKNNTLQEEDILPATTKEAAPNNDNKFSGSIDDLLYEVEESQCAIQEGLKESIDFCNKNLWEEAFEVLYSYVGEDISDECMEAAYYLRGYAFLKMNEKKGEEQYLKAAGMLQEAISYFSGSRYAPFGMAALGKSYMGMGNDAEASGYFKIITSNYKDYVGMPEVAFSIGLINVRKKRYKEAIISFKEVISKYAANIFITDAKIGLGKALFEMNNFSESLKVMKDVMASDPQKIYHDVDILLNVGNSYYHTGKYRKARDILSKAYNFFPEHETNHIVLTRIGDTYIDEKEIEKATKVFKLVIDKFPGTDGFVISSMRLAEHLDSQEERERIYKSIINGYPDNPMANLSMLRLADIRHKNGEFEKSIATIKGLLAQRSRSLRKEALYIMEQSYKSLFEKRIKESNYLSVLTIFEEDRRIINRFESPELSNLVGKSYVYAHLYEQAYNMLKKSYLYFEKGKRPQDLIFNLGVAMHESGREDDALKILNSYIRLFSKGDYIEKVYFRIGKIKARRKEYAEANKNFNKAYQRSKDDMEKVNILNDQAVAYSGLGDYKSRSSLLIKAINILSQASDNNFSTIYLTYIRLGESYMQMKVYSKAADAYAMAKKFAERDQEYPDLSYKLGESYEKGNHITKATKSYNETIASGDPFWGRLAEERLRGIKLKERMKENGA